MTQQPEHTEDIWAADSNARAGGPTSSGDRFPVARQRRGGSGDGGQAEQHDRGTDSQLGPAPTSFERVPPQDLEAEQSVLGGMLLSKDAIADVVEVLKGHDFYRPAHETVYQAILDLYAKGEPADPITVTAELTRRGEIARVGGPGYVHSLVQTVPTAANAEYYAEIVHERAVLRRLVEAGTRITQMGYAADGDVDDIVNSAQSEIYAVTEARTSEDYLPLGDIMEGALDEIEAIGSRSGQMTGVPTGFTDLDSLTNGLHPGQMIVIAARPAMGKALALDTPLPTPDGWTTMGQVRPGARLLGADGRPTRVVAATGVMTGRPCYEVAFDDGTTVIADAGHQWLTHTRASGGRVPENGTGHRPGASVRTTEEIAGTVRNPADGLLNHSVENAGPVRLPAQDLPVAPYTLGVRLGGGHGHPARSTAAGPGLPAYTGELRRGTRDEDTTSRAVPTLTAVKAPERVRRSCDTCGTPLGPPPAHVRDCGNSCGGKAQFTSPPPPFPGDGYIPRAYLRGSVAQRRELLAGILDTNGTVTGGGSVRFAVHGRALADGFRELLTSLGHRCGTAAEQSGGGPESTSTRYVITFTPRPGDEVFRLERKRREHEERRRSATTEPARRFITGVRPVRSVPVRCVQVENPDHMYLATRSMIPTHNSTLALDFARACSIRHNLPSVIFSLEMGRNEIAMRLLSAEARVALHHMRSGSMTDEDWTRLARQMPGVTEAPLYIDDSPNLSMMEIRAKCRRLKQRNDLKLVVIDYLQLMQTGSARRPESRQQEVSEMSRNLKLLAKELELPVIALSQLNRGPEQRTDKKPMVSDLRESGCVTAGTRVLRADDGTEVTMGELLRSGERDIPVWSLDDRLRLVKRTMTHVFPSGTKEVFRLTLASGKQIEATANHPFLTYDGWKPLGELSEGARVAVPRRIGAPVRQRPWDEDELAGLAHVIGRGGAAATHRPGPCASEDEESLPRELFGLPDEQVGLFLRHLWATGGTVTVSGGGSVRVRYGTASERLGRDLQHLLLRLDVRSALRAVDGGDGRVGWSVDVPGWEDQRRFLDRVGAHGAGARHVIAASERLREVAAATDPDTVPEEVWDSVHRLMRGQRGRPAQLERPSQQTTAGASLAGPGTDGRGDLADGHAPGRVRLAEVAEVLERADLEMLATSDVFWDSVVSVESLGVQAVYDATVQGTHNFVANGIHIHNSIEQDADMVVLLHREDAYEKESPRAGEADLIVAKHRNGPTATITVAFQGHYSRFVDMAQT